MLEDELPQLSESDGLPRKNVAKTRGNPFSAGNPGRPRGSRNKTTLAIEALLEGQAEALTQKVVEMGLGGDVVALKLCLERLAPLRRDAPIQVSLPEAADTAWDTLTVSKGIIRAACGGEITPSEAGALTSLLTAHLRLIEAVDSGAFRVGPCVRQNRSDVAGTRRARTRRYPVRPLKPSGIRCSPGLLSAGYRLTNGGSSRVIVRRARRPGITSICLRPILQVPLSRSMPSSPS